MNILHFADAHIGVTTHGKFDAQTGLNDRVLDFLDAFDFIIDYAEEHQVDLVLFAGDMFHHNTPSPSLISEVSIRLKEISNICPMILVPGNHDQAANRVSALQYLDELDIPNIHISDQPKHYIFDELKLFIGAMPYPTYSMFDINSRESTAKAELIQEVSDCLYRWLEIADVHYIDTAILLMHGTIEGVQWGSYSGTALGAQASLMIDDVNFGWDYVALGHIHLHQDLSRGHNKWPPIVYSGSIERVDFGEAVEDKGFVHISIEDDLTWKFVKIHARSLQTIDIDVRGVPTNKIAKRMNLEASRLNVRQDGIVKIRIQADSYNLPLDAFSKLDVHRLAAIDVIVEKKVRPRIKELQEEGIRVQEMEPDELIEEFLIQQDIEDDEIDEILDIFEEMLEELDG